MFVFVTYLLVAAVQLISGESVDGEKVTNEAILTFTINDYRGN